MKNKRGFKYYVRFYLIVLVVYLAYISYLAFTGEGYDTTLLLSAAYLPLGFTFFLFLFDTLFDRIFPSKDKKSDDEFTKFLQLTTKRVNEDLEFSIEDFRRLRDNEKFQKSLWQLYQIKLFGETEEINFVMIRKKFKKDTREYKAVEVVIEEVQKMM